MMIALNEVRWYYEVLRQMPLAHEKEDEIKRGMDAREMTVGLIKLHQSDAEALDPQRMSPEMLEEQRGKAQKLKLQVAGMLEGVKRADAHLKEAIAQSRQKPQPL